MKPILALVSVVVVVAAAFVSWDRYLRQRTARPVAPFSEQADHILIDKSDRVLVMSRAGQEIRRYSVALGFAPDGDKSREGDGKTPEGEFVIDRRNPRSSFHLSLGIDYPKPEDIARAESLGVSPGGDIFIHGQPNGLGGLTTLGGDWTAGCIAVSNAEIEEIWRLTPNGTKVTIRP